MSTDFQYDVFLSHSAKDKAIVRPIAERLRADGLKVWFDEWMLMPGDSIPAKIEEGLERSRVLVLCMSANSFGSDWAELEAGTFRFCDPLNEERRFIPLRLDDAAIKGSLAQFLYINWLLGDGQSQYPKLLKACIAPAQWLPMGHGPRQQHPPRLPAASPRFQSTGLMPEEPIERPQQVADRAARRKFPPVLKLLRKKPLLLVEELQRLTIERENPHADEPHVERDLRQTRIEQIVEELREVPSPRQHDMVVNTRLVRVIGKGNFGVVWQGVHHENGEPRAVKIFDFDRLGLGLSLYHFRRGVRAMLHLGSNTDLPRSVVRVYEAEESSLAFTMPYLEGHDLTNIANRGWSLSKKLDVFREIAGAVLYAHGHKVLHRDIKPANIVLTKDGLPVLTDFDIADLLFAQTLSCQVGGTVSYAAPEQLMGKPRRDGTEDIFSLGRLLHFLLIERDPDLVFDAVPALEDLRAFPDGLGRIIRKCTVRTPEERYQSVGQILVDLDRSADSPSVVGTPSDVSLAPEIMTELYEIAYRSDAAKWFAIWRLPPTPQRILRCGDISDLADRQIRVDQLKQGQLDQGSITHGGPPYRLSPKSFEQLKASYAMLRKTMLDHLIKRNTDASSLPNIGEDDKQASQMKSQNQKPIETTSRSHDGTLRALQMPIHFLNEAIKAVPAVKWALGVGGVVSVIAIIAGFGVDLRVAGLGTFIMLSLMGMLVIFARATALVGSQVRLAAFVFTWFVLVLFIATSSCLFCSVFFKWPVDLQVWLRPK